MKAFRTKILKQAALNTEQIEKSKKKMIKSENSLLEMSLALIRHVIMNACHTHTTAVVTILKNILQWFP